MSLMRNAVTVTCAILLYRSRNVVDDSPLIAFRKSGHFCADRISRNLPWNRLRRRPKGRDTDEGPLDIDETTTRETVASCVFWLVSIGMKPNL